MKNSIYKLIIDQQNNQTCLTLSQNNSDIRKWFGEFAAIIFQVTTKKFIQMSSSENVFYLKKNQIHQFFTEVTYLYQQAIWSFDVEKDISQIEFPTKCTCIAESVLLQIRMNNGHPNYDELLSNYLDVFQNRDYSIFSITVDILVKNKLIQIIKTKDGNKFFDKNPKPHRHIFFNEHNKLVDCSNEISTFFQKFNTLRKGTNLQLIIFTILMIH